MVRVGLAVLAVALALAAVPAGQGQAPATAPFSIALEVDPHGAPIVPSTAAVMVPFAADITCEPGSIAPMTPLTLALSATAAPAFALVTVSPATVSFAFTPAECLAGATKGVAGNLSVTVDATAPAGSVVDLALDAQLDEMPESSARVEWTEEVGVFLAGRATFHYTIVKAAPNDNLALPVNLQNLGNARNTVRLSYDPALTSSELRMATETLAVEVAAFSPGIVNWELHTPPTLGYTNEQYELALDVAFAAKDDPDGPAEVTTIHAVIQVQGTGAGEAGSQYGLVLVLLVVLAAALVARRLFQR